MIRALIKTNPTLIKVEGHAGYDHSGKDIVCASVSTAIILSANLIKRLGEMDKVLLNVDDGYFLLEVKQNSSTIKAVLDNLVWTLEELEIQYPKYIKIKKEG